MRGLNRGSTNFPQGKEIDKEGSHLEDGFSASHEKNSRRPNLGAISASDPFEHVALCVKGSMEL